MRWLAVAALALGCNKSSDAPKLRLDSGVAAAKDAAPPADAAAPAPPPAPVPQKVVVGDGLACALLSDATVVCKRGSEPEIDEQLRAVKDIAVAKGFACALLDDTSVACWGDIGFGASGKTPKPAGVPGVTKVKRIFALGGAACAAMTDGALACWGDVDERGRITHTGAHRAPTAVAGVDHVTALAERAALRDDGDLVYFEGGVPKRAQITDGVEVGSSGDIACVLRADHEVYCAAPVPVCAAKPAAPPPAKPAKPAKGKAGKKPAPPSPEPTKASLEKLPLGQVTHLALGPTELCAVVDGGKLACLDRGAGCRVVTKAAPKRAPAPKL